MGKIIRIKNCRDCIVTPQSELFRKCGNLYTKDPTKGIPSECKLEDDPICEFYPNFEDVSPVCGAGSDVSGTFICTGDFSEKCQWAIQKRKEESKNG